ncbi:GntR family transcriptional regulator [Glycomyces buryatensis]|uniref:GntR family transcriptional regulator n=1 Tax=Glycomyces buryatensis TaxID=2570927 RepID=A0A4S8Q8G2_9ACTN|nr:GntR family transcriptional regulator [Glycomyces buryatensis]THV40677.1 GntR family transcriptional regulator [Glycomyces buryatensis]
MGEMLVVPKRETLADKAHSELKSRILQSVLEPGTKLSIDGLARTMRFSQTPLREALARLEAEGLVERRPLVGYTVTPLLTSKEFNDLFEIRLLLEPIAARMAAERPRKEHPEGLNEIVGLENLAQSSGGEFHSDAKLSQLEFTEADARFHWEVARHGSSQFANAIRRLDAHLHLHRAYLEPEFIRETEAEHQAIAAAIIGKKPLAAEEAMRRHLERSRVRHATAFRNAESAASAAKPRAKRAKTTQ